MASSQGEYTRNRNWIDTETLKFWLHTCGNCHGLDCYSTFVEDPSTAPSAIPDGDQNAAKDTCTDTQSSDKATPTTSSLPGPRWLVDVEKYCLIQAKPYDQYAALSYVWCNDDEENLHQELQNMAAIYAQAYVTIVAANGWDANHGLRGILRVTEPRYLPQSGPNLAENLGDSLQPYSSILFPRIDLPRNGFLSTDHHVSVQGGTMGLSDKFVLTYPSDAYRAITGLLSVWSRSFRGGFVSGLPQMFFESALLWQPRSLVQRRATSPSKPQDYLPSWSWIGWEGDIHSQDWACRWDLIFPVFDENGLMIPRVRPLLHWFCGNPIEEITLVVNSSLPYVSENSSNTLEGSSPGLRNPKTETWTDRSRPLASTHSFAGIHSMLPIAAPQKYLFCRTKRAFVRAVSIADYTVQSGNPCLDIVQKDENLHEKGYLMLKSSIEPPSYNGVSTDFPWLRKEAVDCVQFVGPEPGYELISLSLSTIELGEMRRVPLLVEGKLLKGRRYKDLAEVYNVMWIEWEEGVAYRRGLGQMFKESWESLDLEEIDVTLG
ncbi:hypothetical protein K402DRAFT_401651 [Aulographum hederae CBS 113979]|uniref:Heterokaryon incompatibility domain-containing protein n=1 Tax=Aulographum hederae CBS 113979 TaxID=1176131 RepID=A0A6G1HB73_9PEZI|nr:hypothetical protein K402DRAFT_401651 [Aulographum hederae CBS 113979]